MSERDATLDELIRMEGLAEAYGALVCSKCNVMKGKYRCLDCFGRSSLECSECIVQAHSSHPLHRLEVSIVSASQCLVW